MESIEERIKELDRELANRKGLRAHYLYCSETSTNPDIVLLFRRKAADQLRSIQGLEQELSDYLKGLNNDEINQLADKL